MRYTNLMLIYTEPLYWNPRPVFHAEQLRQFLRFLLDPEKPGYAALGIHAIGSRRTLRWLSEHEAIRWVEQTYQQVWLHGGRLLQQYGKAVSEYVFDELFTEHKAEIFMDKKRFQACLSATAELLTIDTDHDYYVGFSVDWSHPGTLLWAPQLRISNFWPESRRLAPPPDGIGSPYPMSPQQAADVLEHLFWEKVETAFRILRRGFHLGEAGVWIGEREFQSPVFYYAEPTEIPKQPEEFLELPDYLSGLEELSRVTLGTHDPRSLDVMGAFLQNNLLTLRREIAGGKSVRSFYLVIPWWPTEREQWIEEVERELVFIADKWSFVEFSAAYGAYDIMTDIEMPAESMALWSGSLDTAAKLTRDLHQRVAFEPIGSPRKKTAFYLVKQLRMVLARLEMEVLRVTDDVMQMERWWRAALESSTRFAKRAFTARPLPRVRSLLDSLPDFFVYRATGETAQQAVQRARQLRETFDSVEKAIQDLLEQEQREEREQEERLREAQREQEDRRTRILGYGLAALAVITAFPILIGQMGWSELKEVISKWPRSFLWIGRILEILHPYLVFIATIAAGTLIVALMVLLVWTVLSRPNREDRVQRDELSEIGSKIARVWQLVSQAEPCVKRLRKKAWISRRVPGEAEDEETQHLRQRIDQWDTKACEGLLEVWEWLNQQKPDIEAVSEEDDLQALQKRVHFFIIATELLDNRPTPFPFPVALCLFRHKSTDFVPTTIVSKFEFEHVLNGYGFGDAEVAAIDQWAEQELSVIERYREHELAKQGKRLKDLPPREFVKAIREVVGVSSLHEREIGSPTPN